MVNEIFKLTLPFIVGLVLGVIFFVGLWLTVKKGLFVKQPALWFLGSFFLRIGIVFTGFYFVAGGNWDRFLACLLGFILIRYIVTRLVVPQVAYQIPSKKGAEDAP